MSKRNRFLSTVFLSFFLFSSILLVSCSNNQRHIFTKGTINADDESMRIQLDGKFYYAVCPEGEDGSWGADSDIEDALKLNYTHLDKMRYRNLYDIAGSDGKYLWLKAEFEIPETLKDDDLSMVIPYLHFAGELYLNGDFVDSYGFMDEEHFQDAGYGALLFDFPVEYLNQDGKNTVLIKVYALGFVTISPGVFVGLRDDGWAASDIHSFWQSKVYIFFMGIMMAVCFLFFVLFAFYRKDLIYLYFALLNVFSIFFFSNLAANELPWVGYHGGFTFLTYTKLACCIGFFGMAYMSVIFIFTFLHQKHHKIEVIMRCISIVFSVVCVIAAPDYKSLMKIFPILVLLSFIDLLASLVLIIINLSNKEKKDRAMLLFVGSIPLIITLIIDLFIKAIFRNINLPYFTMFGWQGTIIFFFTYFSIQYRRTSLRLEYLNTQLENEVAIQTEQLRLANKKLDAEMKITHQDIHTAALVQEKLFHPPLMSFNHWDIAVYYQPLSVVSGDFYNFYSMGSMLYGVSLFDASGHGVTASLITMLAENIIQQTFKESNIYGENVSVTMERINSNFIQAKGDIENYLTGILMNIKEQKDFADITLVNAAHPYPELYHAAEGYSEEILPDVENPSYGPVGMDMLEVHYTPISITMEKDDVLVLFTDVLTEAVDEDRKEFGRKEIETILKESADEPADAILKKITDTLSAYIGSAPQNDDITIIVMKRI